MITHMKYFTLTWLKLHQDCFRLAQKIEEGGEKFDLIVTMARGGLTIAHILSDFLKLPITSFTIKSYARMNQTGQPVITHYLGSKLEDKKVLLLDDVSDTGKTFLKAIEYMKTLKVSRLKTAALYLKPHTKFIPNYYSRTIDAWIIYPYDMRETIEAIQVKLQKRGMKPNLIKTKLEKLGIPIPFISAYLSY